jgi:glycerophosphoryl diester phosphodiesterase
LAEILDLARHSRTCAGRPVGVAPETKHPSYFSQLGLPLEPPLIEELTTAGLNTADAPVIIQSFETTNLKQLNLRTDVRLIQLINCSGRPWDLRVAGDPRRYADLATRAGLQEIATYADEVGFCKDVMIPRGDDNQLAAPTAAIGDAHDAGLDVIGWTFRRENRYLPLDFRVGADLNAVGNLAGEIQTFLDAGMDGFFTDNPDIGAEVALPEEAFAS